MISTAVTAFFCEYFATAKTDVLNGMVGIRWRWTLQDVTWTEWQIKLDNYLL